MKKRKAIAAGCEPPRKKRECKLEAEQMKGGPVGVTNGPRVSRITGEGSNIALAKQDPVILAIAAEPQTAVAAIAEMHASCIRRKLTDAQTPSEIKAAHALRDLINRLKGGEKIMVAMTDVEQEYPGRHPRRRSKCAKVDFFFTGKGSNRFSAK